MKFFAKASIISISKPRRMLFRTLIVAASLLFALLVVELVLRVLCMVDPRRSSTIQEQLERSRNSSMNDAQGEVSMRGLIQPSANSEIVYEAKPGLKGLFRGKPFSINRFGMRGEDYNLEKPPGMFRIAGLGDSVMFGWGVDQNDFYLKVLERKLNELPQPHPRYEVMNFALPGYNTYMEVAAFEEKALPFHPDLVIIQFVNNDFGIPHFMLRPPDPFTLEKSFLWELIATRRGWISSDDEQNLIGDRLEGLDMKKKRQVVAPYWHMVGPRGYRRAMEKLAALTRPLNIPVIILRGSYSEQQGQIINHIATAQGFHLLDIGPYSESVLSEMGLTDEEKANRALLWVGPGDHHPNALGHEIYVVGLLDKMAEMGVIPQSTSHDSKGPDFSVPLSGSGSDEVSVP
ncbi:MAG: SGNH/GDSL hydrolase family protein [Lentisphaerota bacterium]